MKILISADIEGVSGVVHPDQIYPDGKFYKETLEKWILELSAIVDGLYSSGVKDIVINDSHNHMRNIDNLKRREAISKVLNDHNPCMTMLYVAALADPSVKVESDAWACSDN